MAKNMAHFFYVIDVQFLFLMSFENLYGEILISNYDLWFMIVLLLLIEV
jgi:hypothetical protein